MYIENSLKQPHYFNPKIIFVITWNGKLRVLRAPFKVKAIKPIHSIIEGKIYLVKNIKESKDEITIFEVNGSYYRYFYFDILVS